MLTYTPHRSRQPLWSAAACGLIASLSVATQDHRDVLPDALVVKPIAAIDVKIARGAHIASSPGAGMRLRRIAIAEMTDCNSRYNEPWIDAIAAIRSARSPPPQLHGTAGKRGHHQT